MKPNPRNKIKPESKRAIENLIRSNVNELKKSSMTEMFGEATIQMQLTAEALTELKQDKKFLFLLGQVAELHAILYLAKVEPKRIQVKQAGAKKTKAKKKKARK